MSDQPKRRGRPPKFARDDGREIHGLSRHSDGRHYATFSKPRVYFSRDVTQGIREYRQWQAREGRQTVAIGKDLPHPDDPKFSEVLEAHMFQAPVDEGITLTVYPDGKITNEVDVDSAAFWDKVRDVLTEDLKLAAQKTGIRELEWLPDLKPPPPPISLSVLGELYFDDKKDEIGKKEWNNSRSWWDEFCRLVEPVKMLNDLDKEAFRKYAQKVKANQGSNSDSYVRSRFHKIKTILNHAYESADIPPDLIARLKVDCKKPLRAPPQPRGNPLDITPTEFADLLTHADPQMRAMLLLAMNGVLYPVDIHRIRWPNVDLVERGMVFDRVKKNTRDKLGTVRVAVLWQSTCDALAELRGSSSTTQPIFMSIQKKPLHIETIRRRFNSLKVKANIKRNITFANIRDSATTVAARNAPQAQYQVLMGHVLPGADESYIRKNPWFVKDACAAIEQYYFREH